MTENAKKPSIRFKGFTDAWEQRKFSELYKKVSEKNDLSYGISQIISVANMYYKADSYITEESYLLTYNVFLLGDIAFEGNKSKDYAHGRFVENTIGNGIVSHVFDVFRPKMEQYDLAFWKYAINNERLMGKILVKCTKASTMMTNLVAEDFLKEPFKVPEYEEQRRIGEALSKLDNLITLHQRKYDKLVNVKKALLEKMFPFDDEKVPKIRFKGFTEAWEQRKLGDCIELSSGRDYKHLSEGNIPVYGTGGYMLGVDKALSYEKDGIGIGRKGTIDKPYLLKAPFWTVDTLFFAIPKEKTAIFFLLCLFSKIDWKSKDESTGVPSLSKQTINAVEVIVSKTYEQETIGAFFQKIDNLITLHQRKLEKLKNIKKSLLEKMFV